MAKRTLHLVDEPLPDAAKVVVSMRGPAHPVLSGGGRVTFLCGGCGSVVARRVDPDSVRSLVLQCPDCCRYNAAPA